MKRASSVIVLAVAATVLLAAISFVTWTVQAGGERSTVYPLTWDDPAARLDPAKYRDAKPVPVPRMKEGASPLDTLPRDARWIVRDLETGRTWIESSEELMEGASAEDIFAEGLPGQEPPSDFSLPFRILDPVRSVIGPDSRKRVTNVTAYPWRTVCKLWMEMPDGTYMGTGTLIGLKGNVVLTAGHCITEGGSWARSIEVLPGLYHSYKPYGSHYGTKVAVPVGWANDESFDYDIGVVILKKKIGLTTGTLGYAYFSKIDGSMGNIAGYPGDKEDTKVMYYAFGKVKKYNSYQVQYTIDTYAGQSGSAVYGIDSKGYRWTFAAHSHHNSANTMNYGTFIDQSKFNWIKKYAG